MVDQVAADGKYSRDVAEVLIGAAFLVIEQLAENHIFRMSREADHFADYPHPLALGFQAVAMPLEASSAAMLFRACPPMLVKPPPA